MKHIFLYFTFFISIHQAQSQIVTDVNKYLDTLNYIAVDGEIQEYIELPEVLLNFSKEEIERIRTMKILERRIRRVYPYVVATSDNLLHINQELDKLKTKREKKRYVKAQEKELEKRFKEPLKKLSRKDGQILVKLIHRQTGQTTFNLVKEFKSGWSAFWSNQTAKLFDIQLKATFQPNDNLEDFYIEFILEELSNKRMIQYIPPALQVDRSKMMQNWKTKLGDSAYYPQPLY
ncbi:MAG TPA: DUF4294 domain-containing protein [Flavobacterium sp.]|nr:DUF4294 domain-containing protein [Flavobacterium sp.]